MSCTLLDIGCHLQGAAWEWWQGVGTINKLLIVAGLTSIVIGIAWSWGSMLKRIGGWPAVIGAALALLGLVLTILPRAAERPPGADPAPPAKPKPKKPKPPFQFGVERDKPKERPTLIDLFKGFG